jgi:hypothetical protein
MQLGFKEPTAVTERLRNDKQVGKNCISTVSREQAERSPWCKFIKLIQRLKKRKKNTVIRFTEVDQFTDGKKNINDITYILYVRGLRKNIITCMRVAIDGVCIGNWIY